MTRVLICLTATLLFACDPTPRASAPLSEPSIDASPAPDAAQAPDAGQKGRATETPPTEAAESEPDGWLVWTRDAEGVARTFWVRGTELRSIDGIVLAVDGAPWRWSVSEEELPTDQDCEWIDLPAAGGTGANVSLTRLDGEGSRELLTPERAAARESNEWREHVRLMASAGPYLFVQRTTWSFACGAHGSTSDGFFVFDARTGAPAAIEASPSQAMREDAWRVLQNEDLFTDGRDGLTQSLFLPVFDPEGIAIEHQLTAETCYACGDGEWDSYTVSARLRSDEVPAALAPELDVPPAVLDRVRAAAPDAMIGGVSHAPAAMRGALDRVAR